MDLNRRDFLKGGAIFGSGAALAGLAGCGKKPVPGGDGAAKTYPNGVTEAFLKGSEVEADPITSFIEEAEFDIVVVGAGTAGVPAVLSAVEEGATVACLQKQNIPQGNGNGSGAIILEESNELGIQCYKHGWAKEGGFRYNDDLLELFMRHSGETCMWLLDRAKKAGFPDFKLTNMPQTYEDGKGKCAYFMKSIT
ncbi:MAG: twin-arginine translocation signal domain-containing protein, partial [Eggerthellaceae bacterium]|nr:twin-arginine translocation signal domain-containing protein [Eggerthellaceae bacterium]